MSSDDEILKEFLTESRENLDRLDVEFVELERNPGDCSRIAEVFRTIHTIKGTCGFLGFPKLEALSHAGESLLARMRDGDIPLTADVAAVLLELVDAVRAVLGAIERTGTEGEVSHESLMAALLGLADGEVSGVPRPAAAAVPAPVPQRTPAAPVQGTKRGAAQEAEVEQESAAHADGRTRASDSTVRVDVGVLDKLMDLVGELVLARNQMLKLGATIKDSAFAGTCQRLNLLTTELQEGVMKTRMQPVGSVWAKLPRLMRDVAHACGKQAAMRTEGDDTDLDRTVIEAIKDPLTHIVRNAIDHGIESPDAREAVGKPPVGTLSLRAFHEGGQVNIEISDDGGGIDPQRLREAAVRKGLVSAEAAARLSDREALGLIFAPGFSTAAAVTSVSGRGVGMDVVRNNIEKIGGNVDVQSTPGQGTTVRMKIPLTLAIVPALVVFCAGGRYAIPQVSLLELVRVEGERAREAIERVHETPVYRLRGELLPLVELAEVLGRPPVWTAKEGPPANEDAVLHVVVLQADDRRFGLVVDEVSDTEEIVVKPLGRELKGLAVFAGATIMGDGRVALILDVLGIAQQAGLVASARARASAARDGGGDSSSLAKSESLLLFSTGGGARMAIPLAQVARLEELAETSIEAAGEDDVAQCRGDLLRLVRLDDAIGRPVGASLQAIVLTDKEVSVGIVVDRIVDIVEEPLVLKHCAVRSGVLGVAVLQERVTEILDADAILRGAKPAVLPRRSAA